MWLIELFFCGAVFLWDVILVKPSGRRYCILFLRWSGTPPDWRWRQPAGSDSASRSRPLQPAARSRAETPGFGLYGSYMWRWRRSGGGRSVEGLDTVKGRRQAGWRQTLTHRTKNNRQTASPRPPLFQSGKEETASGTFGRQWNNLIGPLVAMSIINWLYCHLCYCQKQCNTLQLTSQQLSVFTERLASDATQLTSDATQLTRQLPSTFMAQLTLPLLQAFTHS